MRAGNDGGSGVASEQDVQILERRKNPSAREQNPVETHAAEREGQRQPLLQNPEKTRCRSRSHLEIQNLKVAEKLAEAVFRVALVVVRRRVKALNEGDQAEESAAGLENAAHLGHLCFGIPRMFEDGDADDSCERIVLKREMLQIGDDVDIGIADTIHANDALA